MKPNIGLTESVVKNEALELNKLLADEVILYSKTRNYHWNIEGSNFMEIHKFYEDQFDQLSEIIDSIAERIRTIGHYAEARLKDFIELTRLAEEEYTNVQSQQLKFLLRDHESIIISLRKVLKQLDGKSGDFGTIDFLTGLLVKHEKMAWFIRSFLK